MFLLKFLNTNRFIKKQGPIAPVKAGWGRGVQAGLLADGYHQIASFMRRCLIASKAGAQGPVSMG